MNVLEQAVQEVAESGTLSFPVRRKLWEAMGPYEVRPEDNSVLRQLTEPLRRRAELALACARKVSRIWSAYDREDKRPQKLIRQIRAYLDGKLTAEALDGEAGVIDDFMSIVDEEPDSSAPAAALAAWNALVVALHDEPLLEPRYADAADDDLDAYDWDAAREASEAWAGADEEAGPGKRKVRRMKFWAWYLEEAARLLGEEGFKFPPQSIKAFAEKQNPPKPVPEEVTLESMADFLGTGKLCYCCRNLAKRTLFDKKEPLMYYITTRWKEEGGVCPKCKAVTTQVSHWMSGNALEWDLPGDVHFMAVEEIPFYRCPDHPEEWISAPGEYINRKALFKRYIAGAGRAEALKRQIEERAVNCFSISENNAALNRRALDRFLLHALEREAVPGLKWTSREDDSFALDLSVFGPYVFFLDLPYEEFVKQYPQRVRRAGERAVEIDFAGVWARCRLDEGGALERVEITHRFRVQLRNPKRDEPRLALGFQRALGMSEVEAKERAEFQGKQKYVREREEMDCLSGLSRAEAERILAVLRGCGIQCRIMPWLIAKEGDTW